MCAYFSSGEELGMHLANVKIPLLPILGSGAQVIFVFSALLRSRLFRAPFDPGPSLFPRWRSNWRRDERRPSAVKGQDGFVCRADARVGATFLQRVHMFVRHFLRWKRSRCQNDLHRAKKEGQKGHQHDIYLLEKGRRSAEEKKKLYKCN